MFGKPAKDKDELKVETYCRHHLPVIRALCKILPYMFFNLIHQIIWWGTERRFPSTPALFFPLQKSWLTAYRQFQESSPLQPARLLAARLIPSPPNHSQQQLDRSHASKLFHEFTPMFKFKVSKLNYLLVSKLNYLLLAYKIQNDGNSQYNFGLSQNHF